MPGDPRTKEEIVKSCRFMRQVLRDDCGSDSEANSNFLDITMPKDCLLEFEKEICRRFKKAYIIPSNKKDCGCTIL